DADTGANPIVPFNAYANTSNPQTIYIRVENNTNSSIFTTSDFDLTVHPLPVGPNLPDVVVCDSFTLPALPAGFTYHTQA
ncbi:MAG TPA: hypothetical protein PLA69_04405, partial [Flavobacterium sp.]|nr:hypothetical protein [Flavobacterium sp.]